MPNTDPAQLALTWVRVVNDGASEHISNLFAPDLIYHAIDGGDLIGNEALRRLDVSVLSYRSAFPDLRMTVNALAATDDTATLCWTLSGTHQHDFSHRDMRLFGVPPTGRPVSWSGIDLYRVAGDRITEVRTQMDALGMVRQLGLRLQMADGHEREAHL